MDNATLALALGITETKASVWGPFLSTSMRMFGITGRAEIASFFAQIGHESNHLKSLEENLNYSAEGLANTWPTRYRDAKTLKPNTLALSLHRKPRAIANITYANRMGNGDAASGDGWTFRGRGLIQLTGRANYKACGDAIGLDLISKPDWLLFPEAACKSAAWFWQKMGLDALDDDLSVLAETKKINGGTIGLAERQRLFFKAFEALNGKV